MKGTITMIAYRIEEGEYGDVLIIYKNDDINDVIFRFKSHSGHGYGVISEFVHNSEES